MRFKARYGIPLFKSNRMPLYVRLNLAISTRKSSFSPSNRLFSLYLQYTRL